MCTLLFFSFRLVLFRSFRFDETQQENRAKCKYFHTVKAPQATEAIAVAVQTNARKPERERKKRRQRLCEIHSCAFSLRRFDVSRFTLSVCDFKFTNGLKMLRIDCLRFTVNLFYFLFLSLSTFTSKLMSSDGKIMVGYRARFMFTIANVPYSLDRDGLRTAERSVGRYISNVFCRHRNLRIFSRACTSRGEWMLELCDGNDRSKARLSRCNHSTFDKHTASPVWARSSNDVDDSSNTVLSCPDVY